MNGRVDSTNLLKSLHDMNVERGVSGTTERLSSLDGFLRGNLEPIERDLMGWTRSSPEAQRSARHLLQLKGKRVRPLCVLLAASFGDVKNPAVRELALAAEMVHAATLLHDDVVDVGDSRRGAPTSRVLFGNAASIFGGDWLLVSAIRKIRSVNLEEVFARALDVLEEMLLAETEQLNLKGRELTKEHAYMSIIEGKTASLFGWAMFAGATAGGVGRLECEALQAFGRALGIGFQLVDDALDIEGDDLVAGKTTLQDLKEGKLTYPVLHAMRKDEALGGRLFAPTLDDAELRELAIRIRVLGGAEAARSLAATTLRRSFADLGEHFDAPTLSCLEALGASVLDRRA